MWMSDLNTLRDAPGGRVDRTAGLTIEAKRMLAADLKLAFADRCFTIGYQPQVELSTQRVVAFEALLRWRHPVWGDVPPNTFISLAEELGMITELGRWALEQACLDAVAWPDDVGVAVNVSALQLGDETFPATVAAALHNSGLAPSRLELEITETEVLPRDAAGIARLHAIQETGVRLAIDDFDIGHSALGHLLTFPFNKVKLDRSFVARLGHADNRHAAAGSIIRAVVALGKDLNVTVLAEGVETPEQLALLVAANCAEGQGYLFSKPVPAEGVLRTLEAAPEALQRLVEVAGVGLQRRRRQVGAAAIPFQQLVETANDIVIVTTPDLDSPGPEIVYVNPAFTRLTGFSAAEAIGLTPRILQGPGTNRGTSDAIRAALRAGRPVHEKVLNYAKSGAPYWLDLHIVPLRDAEGAITHFAAIERDVTLDKRRLDELEYLADRDTLTGIPNRRAFLRAVRAEFDLAVAGGLPAVDGKSPCLALIDVDRFKRVNDELGHAVGDAVLCGMADCLAGNVRRVDMIGRIGGEEFAVCMPNVTMHDAWTLADRLRRAIAETPLATPSGPVNITISVGVTSLAAGDTVPALIDRADAAMYAAKRAGRNRVRLLGPADGGGGRADREP